MRGDEARLNLEGKGGQAVFLGVHARAGCEGKASMARTLALQRVPVGVHARLQAHGAHH